MGILTIFREKNGKSRKSCLPWGLFAPWIEMFFLDFLQNEVLKQKRDDDMRARMVLPSVNDPNVLVLQGVKKAARGNYSCRVGNGIPTHDFDVESEPIFLDVKCE